MISLRSSSFSSGEYSRIGAATINSTSFASVMTMLCGTLVASLISSATIRRTRGSWSWARCFENLDRQLAHTDPIFVVEIGQDTPDLARELEAHLGIVVLRQHLVGLARRMGVRRNLAPDGRGAVARKVIKDLRLDILAPRQFGADLVVVSMSRSRACS